MSNYNRQDRYLIILKLLSLGVQQERDIAFIDLDRQQTGGYRLNRA